MTDDPLLNEDDIRRDTVPVDRDLLVRLARLVADMRMIDIMLDGYTVDESRELWAQCARIVQEYGE